MSSRYQILKYPFSQEARQAAQSVARDIRQLLMMLADKRYEYVIEAAEARVMATTEKTDLPLVNTDDPGDFLVYNTARLIVEKIGDPRLKELQAEIESKTVNRYLGKESDQFVVALSHSSFGWTVEPIAGQTRVQAPMELRTYEIRMKFYDFLEVAPDFHDSSWKLANRPVESGWVPIKRSELDRLVSGKFKKLVLQSSIEIPQLPERLALAVQRFESEVQSKRPWGESRAPTELSLTALPPCIAQMHEDSTTGRSLAHEARFTLAAFLLKIGMSQEDVTNVFRTSSDFVRSLAEYQVRHISSKSDSKGGKGYIPPSCKKLQGSSLCPVFLGQVFDPLCEYIAHPLQFYRTRSWELAKRITDHSWYAEKLKKRQNLK